MKSEEQTPLPATPAQPTPATPYTTQWASGAIPIDPALQQQSQHSTSSSYPHYQYTSHYPQAAYATHYQAYAPQATQAQTTAARQPTTPVTPYQTSTYSLNTTAAASSNNAAGGGGMDTADIATLNDALGSAGVDLRAEEESLQRTQHDTSHSYRSYEDRTRKQPLKPSFDTRFLSETMRTVATQHKVTRIPDESVNYLALALRARLQDLVTAMIGAANHRTDTQFDRPASLYDEDKSPMWSIVVRTDVAKQLAALEKIEREEETRVRKERKERAEMTAAHAAALAAQANGASGGLNGGGASGDGGGEEEGNVKKKRKKDGPGVTARNMSEDVRKKMSNAVATQAAGLGKYSWMTAAASTPAPKPKASATPAPGAAPAAGQYSAAPGAPTTPATTTSPALNSANSTWARPYVPTKKNDPSNPSQSNSSPEDDNKTLITMRDAMFVVEKERGHGGGRGAARGWV